MSGPFNDLIALQRVAENEEISVQNPRKMGNTADIAYGGCAIALALKAAMGAVPATFFCYSLLGFFLGPTLASDKVRLVTHKVRDTRSFKTIRVEVKQLQKNIDRTTFIMTADFQVKEPAVLLYQLEPRIQLPPPEQLLEWPARIAQKVKDGEVPSSLAETWLSVFGLMMENFEVRYGPESVNAQNLSGMLSTAKLSQAELPMTQKSSSYWFRCRSTVTQAESYAAIAFVTDFGLAFIPVSFQNQFITDYGAISSLDCSLRFHTTDFNCNEWLLQEQVTEAANDGRTFSTARVYRPDGLLVATMHQMSIIRAKPTKVTSTKL